MSASSPIADTSLVVATDDDSDRSELIKSGCDSNDKALSLVSTDHESAKQNDANDKKIGSPLRDTTKSDTVVGLLDEDSQSKIKSSPAQLTSLSTTSSTVPATKVSSTTNGLPDQIKPISKSISNIVQNRSNSNNRPKTNLTGDRCELFLQKTLINSQKNNYKEPSIIKTSSTQHQNYLSGLSSITNSSTTNTTSSYTSTKPLIINHPVDDLHPIIPTLSSQLIFSSVITTQAKSSSSSSLQVSRPSVQRTDGLSLTSAKTTALVLSNRPLATNKSADGNNKSAPDASNSAQSNSGNAVTARLMDMGKKLLDAAREGQTDHVRQLVLNSGAPFTSDWLGTTALHLAAQNGHTEIAEILLRGGVNRDARTKLERTALHLAAQGGWLEVVDLLLIHGSDVDVRDMLKMTPLHWAVERGHVPVAERLLYSGADVSVRNKFQLSPIDIAQQSECHEMIDLFKGWINKDGNMVAQYSDLLMNNSGTGTNPVDLINDNNHNNFTESHEMLDVDYGHLALGVDDASTSRASVLDIDEPCIDLVELEWNTLKFEPEFFLANDEEDEPKVEYLMKIVEELQRENRQLRQRVEQLSTTSQ